MPENESQLWLILYISSAMKDLSPSNVEYYLKTSRQNRAENNITGIAILAQNNVLVIQEGSIETVKAEFESGKQHPAQHSMIKLFDGPIQNRFFDDSLAFKTIGSPEFSFLDDFLNPLKQEYLNEVLQMDHLVSRLIKDFIRNNS